MTNRDSQSDTGPEGGKGGRALGWLSRQIFGPNTAKNSTDKQLAEQLRRGLMTDFRAIPKPPAEDVEKATLYDHAVTLLDNEDVTWPDIYEAQKIKAYVLPDDIVAASLEREIEEATALEIDLTRTSERLQHPNEPSAAEKREFLVSLVSDIQWERKKRYTCRALRAEYVNKVCHMTLMVGSLFFGALIWTVLANDPTSWLSKFIDGNFWYPGLVIAIFSGVLGAWFSLLVSIDKRLSGLSIDELRVAQEISTLIGRLIFGAASAVIFYFLLQSGLFSASILPDISQISFAQLNLPTSPDDVSLRDQAIEGSIESDAGSWLPSPDLCLLIIWGVLCGFSETMIPAALSRNADNASSSIGGDS